MSTLNDILNEMDKSINDIFKGSSGSKVKEAFDKIVDDAFDKSKNKRPEEKVYHIRSYKVPENELRTGLLHKDGEYILVFCQKNEDDIYPLASFIIEHPKRLRALAEAMNTFAEKMEKETK